jgi:transcriptional regulator with XRE-family HTH domain
MAIKPLTPGEQAEMNRLLEENAQISERIQKINEKIATATGGERRQLEDMIKMEKDRLKVQTDTTKSYQKRKEYLDYEKGAYQSMASLGKNVRKEIDGQLTGTSSIASVTNMVVKMKRQELNLDGEALQKSVSRRETLEGLQNAVIEQAKSLAHHSGHHASHEEKIEKFEKSISHLTTKQKQEARELNKIKETLEKKEERIAALHEQQHDLMHHMPGFISDALNFSKGLVGAISKLGPLALVFAAAGAALHAFIELDQAAEDFRKETGLTVSQTKELAHQAHHIEMYYRDAGVELKDVFDTMAKLKTAFSDVVKFSDETVAALTLMKTNFGISAEHAANVQSIFESVGGLSSETAANVQMQVANMAKMSGIAPDKLFKDIAENAEAASTFFKGDLNALTKNAVQAQRMGTSLKQQVSLAEKLLNFESGIEEELVAATFVGGQFNLSRARALAMEGKLAEANAETLKQVQRSGDFRKKDYFTQQQLAKAAGMSVEEINKQLNAQEKLNSLSAEDQKMAQEAIDKGLDITNINKEQLADEVKKFAVQQEQQGQLTRMQNAFMGIVATVGGTLSPLLEGLATILNLVLMPVNAIVEGIAHFVDYVKQSAPLLSVLLGITTAIAVQKGLAYLNTKNELGVTIAKNAYDKVSLGIQTVISNIKNKNLLKSIYDYALGAAGSIAKVPYIGWALAAGVAASAIGFGMSLYSKAGDVMSPADGKTRVSTKEGGLFELSPNDDLVAAPGAAKAMQGGAGGTPQINLAVLSAPLNAMIAEIKGLRADMASGKIAVHMDGAKVTAGVSNQVSKNTRNNFSIA